jgi:hypothetical protein
VSGTGWGIYVGAGDSSDAKPEPHCERLADGAGGGAVLLRGNEAVGI